MKLYGDIDHTVIENIWVECKSKNLDRNVVIGCIYRHPNSSVLEFTSLLERLLHKLSSENKVVFILGDLNINTLNVSHPNTSVFFRIYSY